MKSTTIALDAMGGDYGLRIVVPAALRILKKYPQVTLILVGDEAVLMKRLKAMKALADPRLQIYHASQVVTMDESPAIALRTKKDSSMRIAINLVKQGVADACVSAGNTGALMATARFVLKTLPGIDRPAIVSMMPNKMQQGAYLLDLGANVDSTPMHLFQFAVMASMMVSCMRNKLHPEIALLNIGSEDIKGNDLVKQTAELLSQCTAINYCGYIEGHQIFTTNIDVIVCDGFVGNIALKTSEGIAKLIVDMIRESFKKNAFTRLLAVIASPVLTKLRKRFDPARYNGATLLGLNGIVIKSHGGTSVLGFSHAIEEAINEIEHNVIARISNQLTELLGKGNHE